MPNKKNKSSNAKRADSIKPIIESKKADNEHRILKTEIHEIKAKLEHFSGPLPPPEAFKKYEETLKGSADRIITMAEKQQDHRQKIEKKFAYSNITNERLGLIFGLIVALVAIFGGVYCVHIGQPWTGALIGGGGVGGLIAAFVQGSKAIRREKETNNKK